MKFIKKIAFFFLLLVAEKTMSQNSLIATWKFSKVSSKDSVILSVTEKEKLREFLIKNAKIDFNKIPLNLTDTVNKIIDKELFLVCASFLKLKSDSTFEVSRSEILIPKAIPGVVTDSTIFGTWHFNSDKQIITFQTLDNFKFQYKIIGIEKDRLLIGIIYTESQQPKFVISFNRN
jgi:hypothetical protein